MLILTPSFHCGAQDEYCIKPTHKESILDFQIALSKIEADQANAAIPILKELTKKDTGFVEAWYTLGEVYHKKAIVSQYDLKLQSHTDYFFQKAADCFSKVVSLCHENAGYTAYYYLGENHYLNRNFALAYYFLQKFEEYNSTPSPALSRTENYIHNCLLWRSWQDSANTRPSYTMEGVSSEGDERKPIVSYNGIYILYESLSRKPPKRSFYATPKKEWVYSFASGLDSLTNFQYTADCHPLILPKDALVHDIEPAKDGIQCYVTVEPKNANEKSYAENIDIWQGEIKLPYVEVYQPVAGINMLDAFDGYPTLANKQQTMIFSSDRQGGKGGKDLYISHYEEGKWQTPSNMGSSINTVNDECYPYLSPDGKHLFFASNGHFGLGGYDIFLSHKINDTLWSKPENLGRPINSKSNNTYISTDARANNLIFASNTMSGHGGWDLYYVDLNPILSLTPRTILLGNIKDQNNQAVQEFNMGIINMQDNSSIPVHTLEDLGKFYTILSPSNASLLFQIQKEQYSFTNKTLKLQAHKYAYVKDIQLFPIAAGVRFELSGVSFLGDQETLSPEANIILSDFANFMQENPGLKIKIHGRMKNESEIKSSSPEARAKAVYKFLNSFGVELKQLEYEGHSGTAPTGSQSLIEFEILAQ